MNADMLFMYCYTHFVWGLKSQVFSPLLTVDSFVKVIYNIWWELMEIPAAEVVNSYFLYSDFIPASHLTV